MIFGNGRSYDRSLGGQILGCGASDGDLAQALLGRRLDKRFGSTDRGGVAAQAILDDFGSVCLGGSMGMSGLSGGIGTA